MGVHHFNDLTVSQRIEGKTRIMQVVYSQPIQVVERAFRWLWQAVAAGVAVVVVLVVIVVMLIN